MDINPKVQKDQLTGLNKEKFQYFHPKEPISFNQLLLQLISMFLWLYSVHQIEDEFLKISLWIFNFILMTYSWSLLFAFITLATVISYNFILIEKTSLIYLFSILFLLVSFFINVFRLLFYNTKSTNSAYSTITSDNTNIDTSPYGHTRDNDNDKVDNNFDSGGAGSD